MEISEIIKLEQSNEGLIYIFADNSDSYVAYGLSAFILSKAYSPSITLERKDLGEGIKDAWVATLPPSLLLKHFSGNETLVDDNYIKVDLTASLGNKIIEWRKEFKR